MFTPIADAPAESDDGGKTGHGDVDKQSAPTEVDASRFEAGSDTHHVVGLAGTGALGCSVTQSVHRDVPSFTCPVDYVGEVPSLDPALNIKPNILEFYEETRFRPSHQYEANEMTPVAQLAPGEQVSIAGFTLTRVSEDTVRIQYNRDTATISAGQLELSSSE